MQILGDNKSSLAVGLWYLSHRLALPDPHYTKISEVIVEQVDKNGIPFELMQLVYAESIHVVIYFNNSLAFRTPVPLYLLS